MIVIVVAADKNRAIGINNKIPWHIKSDLKRLADLTRGHTVILGRKSYDSMVGYYSRRGTHMPGRTYIVVTHNKNYEPAYPNTKIAHSIPQAIALAKAIGDEQIAVIGGGSIFAAALPCTDRIYYTEVQVVASGTVDAYFPKLPAADWHAVTREHHQKDEHDEYDTTCTIYERS